MDYLVDQAVIDALLAMARTAPFDAALQDKIFDAYSTLYADAVKLASCAMPSDM